VGDPHAFGELDQPPRVPMVRRAEDLHADAVELLQGFAALDEGG
jgi:hypothetical protein